MEHQINLFLLAPYFTSCSTRTQQLTEQLKSTLIAQLICRSEKVISYQHVEFISKDNQTR